MKDFFKKGRSKKLA